MMFKDVLLKTRMLRGCYRCTSLWPIVPFWFSMEHHWSSINAFLALSWGFQNAIIYFKKFHIIFLRCFGECLMWIWANVSEGVGLTIVWKSGDLMWIDLLSIVICHKVLVWERVSMWDMFLKLTFITALYLYVTVYYWAPLTSFASQGSIIYLFYIDYMLLL